MAVKHLIDADSVALMALYYSEVMEVILVQKKEGGESAETIMGAVLVLFCHSYQSLFCQFALYWSGNFLSAGALHFLFLLLAWTEP
eukprot:4615030-Ditylum_brightwellii.AAC.1